MQKTIHSFDDTKINYDITQVSEQFIIFLHGAGGDLTAWKKEKAFFTRKKISTISIDLRGHGKSERPELLSSYKLEKFAKDIKEVINAEKVKKFILVGHCFGGMVTIMFHKLFPKLAKGYVLIDTTYKAPPELKFLIKKTPFLIHAINLFLMHEHIKNKKFKHANFKKFEDTKDINLFRIFSDIIHTSFKSWIFTYEQIAKFNGIKILRNIKKRVLIIEGSKDTIFNTEIAKKIQKLVKHSDLEIINDENHMIVLNNPKILEYEILNFSFTLPKFIK